MRVLLLSSLWPPVVYGGAEMYAHRLAGELAGAGHEVGAVTLGVDAPEVVAVAPPWPYRLESFERQPAWKRALFQLHDQYNRSAARTVSEAIATFSPDVVHSNVVMGMSMAALTVPSRCGVAHVHTIHDHWLLCRRSTLHKADGSRCDTRCLSCRAVSAGRLAAARRSFADVVIAVSEAVADAHREAGFLGSRIRVVANPVDAPRSVAARPARRDPVSVGFLGALSEAKGVVTLAEAARFLGDAARFVAAGVGPLDSMLRSEPNVELRGWVDGAPKEMFFSDIDVLVVPSIVRDSAPTVVNEAAARGVPVIGAAIGGIPELVPRAQQPLLFPAGDWRALAARVREFAAAPERFTIAPEVRTSWAEHTGAVVGAYADAIEIRSATRR